MNADHFKKGQELTDRMDNLKRAKKYFAECFEKSFFDVSVSINFAGEGNVFKIGGGNIRFDKRYKEDAAFIINQFDVRIAELQKEFDTL